MLHQRLHLKQNKQKQKTAGTETGVQDGPALPAIVCDVIMSATSAWSSLLCSARAPFEVYPKNERNKTRLTLAPNGGSLGVL